MKKYYIKSAKKCLLVKIIIIIYKKIKFNSFTVKTIRLKFDKFRLNLIANITLLDKINNF